MHKNRTIIGRDSTLAPAWRLALMLVISGFLVAEKACAAEPRLRPAGPRKAAIFVENRAGAALNDKIPVLEDFVINSVTEKGLSVISREVAIDALKTYANSEAFKSSSKSASTKALGAVGAAEASNASTQSEEARVSATPGVNALDQLFRDNTSALRLAQNLGADYLLLTSIASLGSEKKWFKDAALETVNVIHTLRVSYRLLEAVQGGSLIGETVKATKTVRFTENITTEDTDLVNGLLEEAATLVAASVERKLPKIPVEPPASLTQVEVTVVCGMADVTQNLITIPDIRVAEDGSITVTTNRLGIQILDATVEVNGTAVGSAPGKFKAPPGLNKMKITREGYRDWARTVSFSEGQRFNVALQMSEAGYARWKDNTAFLFNMENTRKITDATVKAIEGFAQMLRQSGLKVDIKINNESKGKSLFDGATISPTIKSLF